MKWIKNIFKKKKIMSVYKDSHGNLFGSTIHNNDGKSYIDHVSHIDNPVFIGKIKF